MEEQRVTSGELAGSPGDTGVSRPISASEVASVRRDRATGDRDGSGKAAGEGGWEEKGAQRSKGGEEDQFHE